MPISKRKLQLQAAVSARKQLCTILEEVMYIYTQQYTLINQFCMIESVTVSESAELTAEVLTVTTTSIGTQVPENICSREAQIEPTTIPSDSDTVNIVQKFNDVAQRLGLPLDFRSAFPDFVHSCRIALVHSRCPPP